MTEASPFAPLWPLDAETIFLNHGSFGACPTPVLDAQQRLREQMEQNPVKFLRRDLEPRLDDARRELAARRSGASVVVAPVPFPLADPDEVVEAVLARVTGRTKLALLDHVTSLTGLVFPIERLVRDLDRLGVDTLVDGAHAPGMLPLSVAALGAAYYVGNGHKWLCAPKGRPFSMSGRIARRVSGRWS
jgi:isopenicillin-N epimerase